jgi:hypothetical protein
MKNLSVHAVIIIGSGSCMGIDFCCDVKEEMLVQKDVVDVQKEGGQVQKNAIALQKDVPRFQKDAV